MKHGTPTTLNRRSSHTSLTRSSSAVVVFAANSSGGAITSSPDVANTTGSSPPLLAPTVVITWVPVGTITEVSSTAESQKVRSTRATDGGNGSMPTMLRKWT